MKYGDIFKKSFLSGWTSTEISAKSVFVTLAVTFVISLYIFFAYRIITQKTFYSKSFNISLTCVALITSAIIITIQSSIVVSLGMVGALSIVRFRTAIKNPLDLVFLFWAISVGIICGAGFAIYAVLLSLFITVAVLMLDRIPIAKTPVLLIVNADSTCSEENIIQTVKQYAKHFCVKSRNMTASTLDLVIELRTVSETEIIKNVSGIPGVVSASLILQDGETSF